MADPFSILPIQDSGTFLIRSIRFQSVEIDTTPDAFSLTALEDQDPSSLVVSNIVTVSGLSDSIYAIASIDYGISDLSASISVNGGPFEQSSIAVINGDTVQLRVMSADSDGSLVRVSLAIGEVTADWLVSTGGIFIPDGISFSRAPFALARTTTALAVAFTSTEAGQYRVVLVPAGQVPTADNVLAGLGQGGVLPLFDSGLLSMPALVQQSAFVTGLTPGTAYGFHVVLRDELGTHTVIGRLTPTTTLPVAVQEDATDRLHIPRLSARISVPIPRKLSARLR